MGKVRCNARGCERQLWIPKVGLEGHESSAMCDGCKQVALCVNHFSVLWKRGTGCPKCSGKQWTVNLFEGAPFSPMVQAELIAAGGRLLIIDEATLAAPTVTQYGDAAQIGIHTNAINASPAHVTRGADSRGVMMNIAARSQQQLRQAALDPSAPRPYGERPDPYQGSERTDAAHSQDLTWGGVNTQRHEGASAHLPPPPRGWRLITTSDLSPQARGLGGGIAIERERSGQLRMMDDDLIIRNLKLEGEVLNISQSPRKQRLIAECLVGELRQMLYVRNSDVQGYITNPISDDCEVFGARFINDTSFIMSSERPDGRIDLREGRFKRARQIQTRVIGSSLPATPLPATPFNKGHLAFLFKELSGERYLPICRRISNGEDTVIGSEVTMRPTTQATSRDSMTIAWSSRGGELWVSGGSQHPTRVIDQRGVELLAVSADGQQVAWSNEWGFFTYQIEQQKVEQWALPPDLIALGWRG